MQWPQFTSPQILEGFVGRHAFDGTLGWTAAFDSYHPHDKVCVYKLVLLERDQVIGEVRAEIDVSFSRDHTSTAFVNGVRERLAKIAGAHVEVARLRAKYPAVTDAIANCDREDLALRLAYEAAPPEKRKRVLWFGARFVDDPALADWRPWPSHSEAVEIWTNDGQFDREKRTVRAWVLGIMLGSTAAMVVWELVLQARLPPGSERALALVALLVGFPVLFAQLLRFVHDEVVRRRTAHLDEDTALALITDRLVNGKPSNPVLDEHSLRTLRRHLLGVLQDPNY